MQSNKFKLTAAERKLLTRCLKKKHLKMNIEKHARKIRFIRIPSASGRAGMVEDKEQQKVTHEVIDVTTTRNSVDEFLDITERWVDMLFFRAPVADKIME